MSARSRSRATALALLLGSLFASAPARPQASTPPSPPAPADDRAEARRLFDQAVADHLAAEQGAPDREALLRRAAAGYSRALEVAPDTVSALYNLGRAQEALGDLQGAARAYELAASRPGPKRIFYLERWAEHLAARGRTREACEAFEEVVLLEPRLEAPHAFLVGDYLKPGLPDAPRLLAYLWRLVAARQATRAAELAIGALEADAPAHLHAELLTAVAAGFAQLPQSATEILESPLLRRLARLRGAPSLRPGITELVRLYARPGRYEEPFVWWSEPDDSWVHERGVRRRDAFRAALRAVGDGYRQRGEVEVATACYKTAVELPGDPDPLALRDLASVYVEQRDLAALDALAARWTDPAGALFEAKNRLYMEGQLAKVLDYHRALGQIYGALAASGKTSWGTVSQPTTALFQLDRAFRVAERLDDQAAPEERARATRLDPDLTLLYARGLEATGQREKEIDVRTRAATRFEAVGDARAAAKVTSQVKIDGLSESQIRRIESYRKAEPPPAPAPGPKEAAVLEASPAWKSSVTALTRSYAKPELLQRKATPAPQPVRPEPPSPTADYHVHLLGPGLIADWKSLGVTFSRADAAYLEATRLLEPAGDAAPPLDFALLVPMGHLYGNSEFRAGLELSLEEERARLAAENDHVAREAARHPGRALALCSVSVLRPYAWEEIRRCRGELGSAGLKLHLASSEVDLREPEHLTRVAEIAAWAERERVPLLIHLDTQRRGTQAADVERFARVVLEPHPKLVVIVAHLGGSGGFGRWTQSVFATLVDWLEARAAAGTPHEGIYFDLSAVILERESEGVPPTSNEEAAALGTALRRAGLDRLLLGSDYPVFDPRRTAELLVERAGLTHDELAHLLANRAPGLPPR